MPRKAPATSPKLAVVPLPSAREPAPPPPDLGAEGRALWVSLTGEFDIGDSEGLFTLEQACRALDRAERCRARIDEDGELLDIRGQLKSHPLIREETAARALAIRTVQKLGLRLEPVRAVGRPSGSRVS
jgi:hypothetical protein